MSKGKKEVCSLDGDEFQRVSCNRKDKSSYKCGNSPHRKFLARPLELDSLVILTFHPFCQ